MDQGRIAGIDYGTVRIGIALGDLEVRVAAPYATYTRQNPSADEAYFRRLAADERIVRFVVGLPVHTSGCESQQSSAAREFGAWLTHITAVPVDFYDERYTSVEADSLLLHAGLPAKRRRAKIDQVAAQIMLTAYLESGARGTDQPAPLDD